jgi:chorismate mutase/prephenate dehydratase
MTTAVRNLSRATLEDLRTEIDAIDDSLHDLLMRRASLAADIARLKNGAAPSSAKASTGKQERKREQAPFFRPGREAAVVRRILGRHTGPFPASALVRIWREVMGALLHLQGPVTVAAAGSGFNELARDHFGTGARVQPQASPGAAIRALAAGRATVAVVPWPKTNDRRWRAERPWWLALAKNDAPRVVAGLPALADAGQSPTALVVAPMPPESSGHDRTLIAVVCRRRCASPSFARALAASGLKGRIVARAVEGRAALIEVDGFVTDQSVNLEALTIVAGNIKPVVIGAYAVPSAVSGASKRGGVT